MFDGSSIAGWKGINESDMILMPDADSAVMDIFSDDATLNLRCNVIEPATMQGYDRCPRSLAGRAEAYLKSTGVADQAYFGPENEFFVFDDVRWDDTMQGAFYAIDSAEGAWNTSRSYEDSNTGHRPTVKGGYFPVSAPWTRCMISVQQCAWRWRRWASRRKSIIMRWRLRDSVKSARPSTR